MTGEVLTGGVASAALLDHAVSGRSLVFPPCG